MRRIALGALLIGGLFLASAPPSPVSEAPPAAPSEVPTRDSSPSPSPSPSAAPSYQAGPDYVGGIVVRLVPTGVVIDTVGRETVVDLRSVADVWKETSMSASAIEVNDTLDVNGSRIGDAFVARHAWVNIGRLDGVIRSVDGNEIVLLAYQRSSDATRELRVALSHFLEIERVSPGATGAGSRADLTVGRAVGMVLYRPRDGLPRATRIWLSLGP